MSALPAEEFDLAPIEERLAAAAGAVKADPTASPAFRFMLWLQGYGAVWAVLDIPRLVAEVKDLRAALAQLHNRTNRAAGHLLRLQARVCQLEKHYRPAQGDPS